MHRTHTNEKVTETFTDQDGNHRSDQVHMRTSDETHRLKALAARLDREREFTVMRNIVVKASKHRVVHDLQAITVKCVSMKEAGALADIVKASRDVPVPHS